MTDTLTKTQARFLSSQSDEWETQEDEWKAGVTFLRLMDKGLMEWREQRRGQCDVKCGPGSHGGYYWQTRRTAAGRAALGLGS